MKKRVSFTIDKAIADELDSVAGELGLQKNRIVEMALVKYFEAADVIIADKRLSEVESGKKKTVPAKKVWDVLEKLWDKDLDTARMGFTHVEEE